MPTKFIKKSVKKNGGKKKAKSYTLQSKTGLIELKCETDKHDKFYKKSVTINSGRVSSYFDLDWLFDKSAVILICENCSTIKWIKNQAQLRRAV